MRVNHFCFGSGVVGDKMGKEEMMERLKSLIIANWKKIGLIAIFLVLFVPFPSFDRKVHCQLEDWCPKGGLSWEKPLIIRIVNFVQDTLSLRESPLEPFPQKEYIRVVYKGWWFSPCPEWLITYVKDQNSFSKTLSCPQEPQVQGKTESISQEDFLKNVSLSSYLEDREDLRLIKPEDLDPGFKPHPESKTCYQSQDKVYTVCGREDGIIVDLYVNRTALGIMDANARFRLEASAFERSLGCRGIPTSPELTFLMSYCQGDMCLSKTREGCESVDVVAVSEDGKLKDHWEKDGQPDCVWTEGVDPTNACKPRW